MNCRGEHIMPELIDTMRSMAKLVVLTWPDDIIEAVFDDPRLFDRPDLLSTIEHDLFKHKRAYVLWVREQGLAYLDKYKFDDIYRGVSTVPPDFDFFLDVIEDTEITPEGDEITRFYHYDHSTN